MLFKTAANVQSVKLEERYGTQSEIFVQKQTIFQ